jgi:hypothetical protein
MAGRPGEPVDSFGIFGRLFLSLVAKLMREHAHAEVVIIIAEGNLRQVRVNRSFLPTDLPQV